MGENDMRISGLAVGPSSERGGCDRPGAQAPPPSFLVTATMVVGLIAAISVPLHEYLRVACEVGSARTGIRRDSDHDQTDGKNR